MSSVINDNTHYIEFTVSSYEEFVKISNRLFTKYPPKYWNLERYNRTNMDQTNFRNPVTIIYYRINNDNIYMFYMPNDIRTFRVKHKNSSEYTVYSPLKILKYNKDKL